MDETGERGEGGHGKDHCGMTTYRIAVLAGDGIGPEVMEATLPVIQKAAKIFGASLDWTHADVGGAAIDRQGKALPDSTLEACGESHAIFFGSVGGPKWENLPPNEQPERGALLPLRKAYGLYANIRPVVVYPGLDEQSPLKRAAGVDLVVIRELIGGIYFGEPKLRKQDTAIDTCRYDKHQIERIVKLAYESARTRRGKVTSVDKANVLATSVLWRETVNAMKPSDVETEHMYVDNAAMQLVINPSRFDVIVTENLFGDILSDLAASIPGSLGMLPSASLGEGATEHGRFGMYEPSGGSAPDIAGEGIANPIAQILSGALMFRYSFGREEIANAIESAVRAVIASGLRTRDISAGGSAVGTKEMASAVADLL